MPNEFDEFPAVLSPPEHFDEFPAVPSTYGATNLAAGQDYAVMETPPLPPRYPTPLAPNPDAYTSPEDQARYTTQAAAGQQMRSWLDRNADLANNPYGDLRQRTATDPYPAQSLEQMAPEQAAGYRRNFQAEFARPRFEAAAVPPKERNILDNLAAGNANMWAAAQAGVGQMIPNVRMPYAPPGLQEMGTQAQQASDATLATANYVREQLPQPPIAEGATGLLSIGQQMAAGAALGPEAFGAMFAADAAGNAYAGGRNQGRDPRSALGDAAFSGVKAFLFSKLPPILGNARAGIAEQLGRAYVGNKAMGGGDATVDALWNKLVHGQDIGVDGIVHILQAAETAGVMGTAIHGAGLAGHGGGGGDRGTRAADSTLLREVDNSAPDSTLPRAVRQPGKDYDGVSPLRDRSIRPGLVGQGEGAEAVDSFSGSANVDPFARPLIKNQPDFITDPITRAGENTQPIPATPNVASPQPQLQPQFAGATENVAPPAVTELSLRGQPSVIEGATPRVAPATPEVAPQEARVPQPPLPTAQATADRPAERVDGTAGGALAANRPTFADSLDGMDYPQSGPSGSLRVPVEYVKGANYSRDLGEYTDRVWRETSPDDAALILKGELGDGHPKEWYFSNTPDLAMGQGQNKGVMLELDPQGIRGRVNTAKPMWEATYQQGVAELIGGGKDRQLLDKLRAITVQKGAQAGRMRNLFNRRLGELERDGWTKTSNPDGSTTYRKPEGGRAPVGDAETPPAHENAAGRAMLTEPSPTSANEPPRTAEPTPEPPAPVKQKAPGKPRAFSKRDIEQRLLQHYDETEGQADFERQTQAESLGDQTGGASTVFKDRIPGELRNEFTPKEWAQVIRRRIVSVGKGRDTTGGEDAYSEQGMGHDRYVQMVRDRLEGTDAGKTRAALEHARRSPDPHMQLMAELHDNLPSAKERGPTQVVDPSEMPTGTRFSLHGSQFEIVESPDGYRLLKDGDEYSTQPAEAIPEMPADKGSVRLTNPPEKTATVGETHEATERPKFFDPAAEGIKSGAGVGIFGQTTFEPATGNKQGSMFHEPVEVKAGGAESAQDARIRGKFKEGEGATGRLPVSESAAPRIEDFNDRTLIVRGVKENPQSVFGREGLRGLWNKKEQGYIFNKGRRAEVEAEVAKMRGAKEGEVPADPPGDDIPFAPGGGGGVAGANSHAFRQPTQMAGGTTPKVSSLELVKQVEKMTGTPVRVGHGRFAQRKAAGWYSLDKDVTRLKEAEALTTTYHEAGHAIHNKLIGWNTPWPAGVAVEMQKMGRELYGTRKPSAGYRREGLAEYVARRLLGDDVGKVAPKTHEWFEKTVLPAHSDLAKEWAKLEGMAKDWQEQGAAARVAGKIHALDTGLKGKLTTAYEKVSDILSPYAWTNDAHPLERAQKALLKERGIDPEKLPTTSDPAKMRAALKMAAPGTARYFIEKAAVDTSYREVGPSLKDVLTPVKGNLGDFVIYAYARRGEQLHGRGINPGISAEDAARVVKDLETPEFKKASDGITQWGDRLMDYVVDAGALSPESAKAIRDANPVYLPLKRYFDENHLGSPGSGTGRGVVNGGKAIKAIKGSGRSIIDPLEALAMQAEHMITLGNKARVARSIADLAERAGKAGWFAEKVELNNKVQQVTVEQMQKQLEALGADLSAVDLDKLLTVVSQPTHYTGKDNIVSLYRNGQQEFWELHPDVYKVVTEMDKDHVPQFLRFLSAPARLVRAGATSLRASFQLANMVRDAFTATIYGKGPRTPLASLRGIWADLAGKTEAERFRAAGGAMTTLMGQDRAAAGRTVSEMMASGFREKAMVAIKHPLDALRAVTEFAESGPRIEEFRRVYDAKKKAGLGEEAAAIEALLASKDVTINFTRQGVVSGVVNQFIPFFNARVQGTSKFWRTFSSPKDALPGLAKAITAVTLPSLALWMMNKDEKWWKELPAHERMRSWVFSFDGGKSIYRLPMPDSLGTLFGAMPVEAIDSMYQKEPRKTADAVFDTVKSFMPVSSLPELIPAYLKPVVEAATNFDGFRGKPIVPPHLAERQKPSEQYQKWTTDGAKLIGDWLNVSPAKVEHVVSGYTGGLGLDALRWIDILRGARKSRAADTPVTSRFTARDPIGRGYTVQNFYDELADLKTRAGPQKGTSREKVSLRLHEKAAEDIKRIRDRIDAGRVQDEEGMRLIQERVDRLRQAMPKP